MRLTFQQRLALEQELARLRARQNEYLVARRKAERDRGEGDMAQRYWSSLADNCETKIQEVNRELGHRSRSGDEQAG